MAFQHNGKALPANANGLDGNNLNKSQSDTFDNRSDDKGGEPESLAILTTGKGRNFGFISLERASVIVGFDISEPRSTVVETIQSHPIDVDTGELLSQGFISPAFLLNARKHVTCGLGRKIEIPKHTKVYATLSKRERNHITN